ncbi:MAG TPA: tRNA dimethylallyltransferase, partial [Candidatus Limnocylindrales bacterium]|nr:tRNA dimethylallyltransferase [Candidatus Limnocylindrales bacterium]
YIDAVLYNFSFLPPAAPDLRERLAGLSVKELQQQILEKGMPLPENSQNPRHLIRTLETGGEAARSEPLRPHTLVLGLAPDRAVLNQRIQARIQTMIGAGFVTEVKRVAQQYGWDAPGLQATGYRAFRPYFEGRISLDEAAEAFARNDRLLAKRQRTWFRRNKSIHWLQSGKEHEESVDLITT